MRTQITGRIHLGCNRMAGAANFSNAKGAINMRIDIVVEKSNAPTAAFRWQATVGDYDQGDPIGFGPTIQEAMEDLLTNDLELEDEREAP